MTEQKVTSYELSKKLHESGFQGDSHCGWWGNTGYSYEHRSVLQDKEQLGIKYIEVFKAYDCYDLLMWLRENRWLVSPHETTYLVGRCTFGVVCKDGHLEPMDTWDGWIYEVEPQNALALAIIKILGERNHGNL